MDDVLHTAVDQIGRVFDAEVAILLSKDDRLERQPHKASTLVVDEKVFAVAAWVFENGKRAGRYTETLPQTPAQCLPLRTSNRTVGVLGIQMRQDSPPAFDQELLLETFANQVALVIERELLDEAAEHALMLRESERLQKLLAQDLARRRRLALQALSVHRHHRSPSVIVHYIHLLRSERRPAKDNAPLIIDPDAVHSPEVPLERLQPISRRRSLIAQDLSLIHI